MNQTHLMFTHGGLIAAYVNHFFDGEMDEMLPNASLVGLHLKSDQSGKPESLDFRWDFPHIEDDIWLTEFKDFKFEKIEPSE